MGKVTGELSVFFDGQFWVGVVELSENGKITAAKVTFGAKPSDFEVYEFIVGDYYGLRFSPPVAGEIKERHKNPKRVQRDIKKQLSTSPVGTKSQQAMKLLQEQQKTERKLRTREEKETEKQRIYALKQQKRLDKHRGR